MSLGIEPITLCLTRAAEPLQKLMTLKYKIFHIILKKCTLEFFQSLWVQYYFVYKYHEKFYFMASWLELLAQRSKVCFLHFFRPMLSQVLGTEPYVVKRHWAKINYCQEKSWKSQCVEWELLRNESKNSNQMLQMKVPLFSVMLPWFLHACSFHSDKVLVTFL